MAVSNPCLLAIAIAAALSAGSVQAQGGPSSPMPATPAGVAAGKAEVSSADRRFVHEAAAAGVAEVAAGQLAVRKAQSPQVRAFAQRMVDEHTRSNAELMTLASARGITPPAKPDRGHKNTMDKLARLDGDAFDSAYMKHQIDDHEKALKLYERQATSGRDAGLKQLAAQALPSLREHLELARSDTQAASARGPSAAGQPASGTSGAGPMSGATGTSGASPMSGATGGTPGASGTSRPAGSPATGSTAGAGQQGTGSSR